MKPVNRVLLAFKSWDEQKNELQPLLKTGSTDERTINRLQLQHLLQSKHRLGDARPDEQPFIALLNNHINRLEKQLYPNFLQRLFFRIKNQLIDGPKYIQQQEQQRASNMEVLKQQLREKGLGSIAGKLEEHLNPDHKQAYLPLSCQLGPGKHLNFELYFEKDVYGNFQMQQLNGTLLENGQQRYHNFILSDWPGLKANQALSLLEGRALKQQYTDTGGHEASRWVELSTNGVRYYAPDHFDLKEAIAVFPQLTSNREELIRYLENGQQIQTHWKQEGQFQNISVQAAPGNRTLQIFDAKNKPVTAEQLGQKAQQITKAKKPVAPVQNQRKRLTNGHSVHI